MISLPVELLHLGTEVGLVVVHDLVKLSEEFLVLGEELLREHAWAKNEDEVFRLPTASDYAKL